MSQGTLSRFRDRMRATKDATRGPFRLLERRHGLAEIVKGGAVVVVKILRIIHLMMRWNYASALLGEYLNGDDKDTLDDLREAVTKLEDLAPTARRILGGLHPIVPVIEGGLKHARAVLREALETQPSGDS